MIRLTKPDMPFQRQLHFDKPWLQLLARNNSEQIAQRGGQKSSRHSLVVNLLLFK